MPVVYKFRLIGLVVPKLHYPTSRAAHYSCTLTYSKIGNNGSLDYFQTAIGTSKQKFLLPTSPPTRQATAAMAGKTCPTHATKTRYPAFRNLPVKYETLMAG